MQQKDKRKLIYFSIIVAFVVMLAITITIQTTGNRQGYRTVSVVETSGTVVVVKEGIEYPAYSGMKLQEGYSIVTTGNSYARLVLDGDKYVKLESGSKMVFETLGFLGSGKTKLNLERGSMTSELVSPLKENEEYVVNTPNAVLAVRGTYFRLDLTPTEDGELVMDVMTYGGTVSTQRVLPNGEVQEEKVLVDAGYKVCINMDEENTSYVVDGKKTEDITEVENAETITLQDIPDEDMVDIYFSVQNGHELFITEEKAAEDIDNRDIDVEEYTPVYETAKEVLASQETDNSNSVEVYADDSKSIAMAEDESAKTETEESANSSGIPVTDGDGNKNKKHTHSCESKVTKESTCTVAGERTYTCDCGYSYTEEVAAFGHTEAYGGTADVHTCCTVCNETLSSSHSYTDTVTKEATCEAAGETLHSCDCGYEYTSEIAALGHDYAEEFTVDTEATCEAAGSKSKHCSRCDSTSEVTEVAALGHTEADGGTADVHTYCTVCNETLSSSHSYTDEVTKEATCTVAGERTYTCDCGYSYTEEVAALGHTEANGGTEDVHTYCTVCNETLSSSHSYTDTVTTEATCEAAGETLHSCDCGYSYTEEIAALGHDYAEEFTVDTEATCEAAGSKSKHCSRCDSTSEVTEIAALGHTKEDETASVSTCTGCGEKIVDLNATNFPDATFLTYVSTFDTYNDDMLLGSELSAVTTIDVSGTRSADGGISDITGIEHFTELTTLLCAYNSNLTSIDVSALTKLETLDLTGCSGVSGLDLSGHTALVTLNVSYCTALTALDVSNCSSLTSVSAEATEKNSNDLTTVDVSGCTNLVNLNLKYCSYVTELDLQTLENLEVLDVAYSGVTTYTGVTGMSFPNNPKLREVYANHLNVSSIDLSSNTALEVFYNTSNTTATTLDLTNNVNLRELALGDLTQITTLDLSQCTLLEFASIGGTQITSLTLANHPNLTYLELTNSSQLSQLEISNSPNLATLVVSSCSALKTLDISAFTNLEVFYANNAGITTLSGNSTCLDFSANKKLKDIRVNSLTSFSEINLTENTELEKLIYSSMPMTTVDLSNCVSLQNFQTSAASLTSLDFSNCPDMIRIIATNSSSLTSLNVNGCTKLMDVRLNSSNNITSVDLTNAGSEVELGAYLEGEYLVFLVTSGSTTESTIQNATGWDDSVMSITN